MDSNDDPNPCPVVPLASPLMPVCAQEPPKTG